MATYRITVRNTGNAALRNVTVTDKVPTGCDVVSMSEGGQNFEPEGFTRMKRPSASLTLKGLSPALRARSFALDRGTWVFCQNVWVYRQDCTHTIAGCSSKPAKADDRNDQNSAAYSTT